MSFAVYSEKERAAGESVSGVARLYLLDAGFRVLSAPVSEENGAFFFDLYPAGRPAREEIDAYLRSYPQELLLTLCARMPVLFIGTFFAQTGLLVAVVPEGEIKATLSFPAAFHRVPAHVSVSPSAQMRYKVHEEEAFAAAGRWLAAMSAPFALCWSAGEAKVSALLDFCLTRMATLLGVSVSADFSGLPALFLDGLCGEFALGVMLAALMAARRLASADGVQLYAAMEGAPTLHLRLSRADGEDTLPEFQPLLRVAAARGAILDVVCPQNEPRSVQIRACFGMVELSAQGVRERHRFLEGKSPLGTMAVAHAVSPDFPELSFD